MRKTLLIAAAAVGVVIVAIAAPLIYGALNLNTIVKRDRQYILNRLSASIGRSIEAQNITVGLGWGVTLQVSDLQIADDPAFSQLPFVKARQVSGQVEVLPLLAGQVLINRLILEHPQVRILRNKAGRLNISTLGARQKAPAPTPGEEGGATGKGVRHRGGLPIHFLVQTFNMHDGEVFYQEAESKGRPIRIEHVNLDLNNVSPVHPFSIKLELAALGSEQNLSVSGTIGPLMRGGVLEMMDAPIALSVDGGPFLLDRLRSAPQLRGKIPDRLSMPDPITFKAKLTGTARAMAFDVSTDLSRDRVLYTGVFDKPAGTALRLAAAGSRRENSLGISQARIRLADLQARLSDLKFGGGSWSAKVDTNRFDLAPLAQMVAAMAKYSVAGRAEAHLTVASASPAPRAQGTIELAAVDFKVQGSKLPGVNGLTGTVRLQGNSAALEPTTFELGSARASLQGQASSLRPLRATYLFKADGFKLAELLPQRPADEQVSQLAASGTLSDRGNAMAATTDLTSGSGMVSDIPYHNLALRADYDGRQVNVSSLTLDAYGGSIGIRADAGLLAPHSFRATANLRNIDLQQALTAQKAKAANMIKGLLTGQINVAGQGTNIEEVKPTLQGNGNISITKGKLVGVNIVGTALRKINGIPGINTLITPTIVQRNPSLFSDPDTELKLVRLSYVMTGPRLTSHDITVDSDEYRILGDGWFDMDKNVNLSAHVLMSRQFSSELQAEKKNVVYLENQAGEIEIPLIIRGRLPKPAIEPDVQFLVQRAASRAAQQEGGKLLNKYLGNKGLGRFLGGGAPSGGGPSGGAPSGNPPPSNPIAPFERLFH